MGEQTWLDEYQLIEGMRARDPFSLEAIVYQYSRDLFYFTRMMLAGAGSAQDAEECLNDLFLIAWQEFERFDPARSSLRTWLTMRAKYIALNRRRQLLRCPSAESLIEPLAYEPFAYEDYFPALDQQPLDRLNQQQDARTQTTAAGVDVLLEHQERLEEMRRALERLPAFDRYLIALRYFRFASMKEIAARTGLTKHAVEARLWRARKVLRQLLEEPADDLFVQCG
jgi:RNA polymerase sigma factor (sigma-70 family)